MVPFPKEAGYPVGGDFPIKYYMVQMHYDNPNLFSNRTDSSGIRFYIGKELRQYDLGYLTLGTDSIAAALAIPPKVERFIVDSYCSANVTMNFPEEGITVVSAFPHTHFQGRTVWTKLIRNKTAVQYLFNAEAYNFNYQYDNRLPKPIKLYRLKEWLLNQTWTPERAVQWQEFYNTASRVLVYGAAPSRQYNVIPSLPKYQDFKPVPCTKDQTINQTTTIPGQTTSSQSTTTNKARSYISTLRRNVLVFLNMILIVMTIIFD
ncbi:unnamed protein product [Rotaria sp. Silwood1]|nr:unnamed protein product [Rotaria sp. Silwood1]CAF4856318.1 unnamed protein product [Rotaria sp. Silwood1]